MPLLLLSVYSRGRPYRLDSALVSIWPALRMRRVSTFKCFRPPAPIFEGSSGSMGSGSPVPM